MRATEIPILEQEHFLLLYGTLPIPFLNHCPNLFLALVRVNLLPNSFEFLDLYLLELVDIAFAYFLLLLQSFEVSLQLPKVLKLLHLLIQFGIFGLIGIACGLFVVGQAK